MQSTEQKREPLPAELLATASHELRSPLASIKGYTMTLLHHEHEISPEERLEFLLAISQASSRLEKIVDRLLELAQLETKTIPFTPLPVNLISLVQEALTAARPFRRNEAAGEAMPSTQDAVTYTLQMEQANGTYVPDGLMVQGDRRLLRHLLDQLLENAVLYSPRDGHIRVGVRALDGHRALSELKARHYEMEQTPLVLPAEHLEEQALGEIWIKDHGIGIPAEHLKQIFERFSRLDTSLSREVDGLGLGLAICREIVALHRGTMWVESEVGVGSTFHVLLPLSPEQRPEDMV